MRSRVRPSSRKCGYLRNKRSFALEYRGRGRYDGFRIGLQARRFASTTVPNSISGGILYGPMQEYDSRVESGRLRDDEHQRGACLGDLYQSSL